ncbi:hypothetical protein KUL152_29390 [Tenacibaculum sp. KUL152]|nr:hypothetical protein KUL152_29390 [Tenacibaculum sp. KUL152]
MLALAVACKSNETTAIYEKLTNGFAYKVEKQPLLHNEVHFRLAVKSGTLDETSGEKGAHHLIEHIAVESAYLKYKTLFLNEGIELVVHNNATTGFDRIVYHLKVPNNDQAINTALLYYRYIASQITFTDAEIQKHKNVVAQEINQTSSKPSEIERKALVKAISPNSNYLIHPAGSIPTLERLSSATLEQYYFNSYRPKNMVLAATTPGDVDNISSLIKQNFGDIEETTNIIMPERKLLQPLENNVLGLKKIELKSLYGASFLTIIPLANLASEDISSLRESWAREAVVYSLRNRLKSAFRLYGYNVNFSAKLELMYLNTPQTVIKLRIDLDERDTHQPINLMQFVFKEIVEEGLTEEEIENYKNFSQNHAPLLYTNETLYARNSVNLLINSMLEEKSYHDFGSWWTARKGIDSASLKDFLGKVFGELRTARQHHFLLNPQNFGASLDQTNFSVAPPPPKLTTKKLNDSFGFDLQQNSKPIQIETNYLGGVLLTLDNGVRAFVKENASLKGEIKFYMQINRGELDIDAEHIAAADILSAAISNLGFSGLTRAEWDYATSDALTLIEQKIGSAYSTLEMHGKTNAIAKFFKSLDMILNQPWLDESFIEDGIKKVKQANFRDNTILELIAKKRLIQFATSNDFHFEQRGEDILRGASKQHFKSVYKALFNSPENTLIHIEGDIKVGEIAAYINQTIGNIETSRSGISKKEVDFTKGPTLSKSTVKDIEGTQVIVSYISPLFDKSRYADRRYGFLIARLLERRLFEELRIESDLIYSVNVEGKWLETINPNVIFNITLNCSYNNYEQAIKIVTRTINDVMLNSFKKSRIKSLRKLEELNSEKVVKDRVRLRQDVLGVMSGDISKADFFDEKTEIEEIDVETINMYFKRWFISKNQLIQVVTSENKEDSERPNEM